MKSIAKILAGFVAALALGSFVAYASTTPYFGWNPATGLEAFHGNLISGGTSPTVTGCGTTWTGGASAGTISIAGTTCAPVITFPSAAPTGWACFFLDVTTPADSVKQTASSTTSCSGTGTVVSGDVVEVFAIGY